MKEVIWVGNTRKRLKEFPALAMREAGEQIGRLQLGEEPQDWRDMKSIGPGVREIRIHKDGEFRVIYLANRPEGIYLLQAFQKKSQKTAQWEIKRAKVNYAKIGK